jgi:hypothetical protein
MAAFDWSEDKRRRVLKKHGIDFRDVPKLFDEPNLEDYDVEHSALEDRWYILAELDAKVVKVIFIDRGSHKFIVTAFWANDAETAMFYDQLFGYQR